MEIHEAVFREHGWPAVPEGREYGNTRENFSKIKLTVFQRKGREKESSSVFEQCKNFKIEQLILSKYLN